MRGKKWTEKDRKILMRLWGKAPRGEISRRLGRSLDGIRFKACDLGLTEVRRRILWGADEERALRRLYPHAPREETLKRIPRRTWSAISTRAHKLGLNRGTWHNWTQEEDDSLRDLYPKAPREKVMHQFSKVSWRSVCHRARRLGLRRDRRAVGKLSNLKPGQKKIRITCSTLRCKRRRSMGVGLGGQKIYYCPVYRAVVGGGAEPAPECLGHLGKRAGIQKRVLDAAEAETTPTEIAEGTGLGPRQVQNAIATPPEEEEAEFMQKMTDMVREDKSGA